MRIVLIIAADPAVASLHRARLETDGFRVEAASTPEEGLALARERPPVAVVLDIEQRGLTGAQLVGELRARAGARPMPIIVLCNAYLPLIMEAARKAGATRCLDKVASSPDTVASLLNQLLPEPDILPEESGSGAMALSKLEIIRCSFLARAEKKIAQLRADFSATSRQSGLATVVPVLTAMTQSLESIATSAGALGHRVLAQMAAALSALAYHLSVETDKIKASPLRTIGTALDALVNLCKTSGPPDDFTIASPMVLVVDDLAIARQVNRRSLERAQINVVTLHSPRLALEVFRQNAFDVVLLDLLMPEMSGFDLCREMRALPHGKDIPVIFVTGIDDFEARAQAKVHGGSDFMAKPFLPAELATKVLLHLRNPSYC